MVNGFGRTTVQQDRGGRKVDGARPSLLSFVGDRPRLEARRPGP